MIPLSSIFGWFETTKKVQEITKIDFGRNVLMKVDIGSVTQATQRAPKKNLHSEKFFWVISFWKSQSEIPIPDDTRFNTIIYFDLVWTEERDDPRAVGKAKWYYAALFVPSATA